MTWLQLWKRIGKQTIKKTQNTKVNVLINGKLKECKLVFTNSGADFHLEPIEMSLKERAELKQKIVKETGCKTAIKE